jgi:hypothetical protein
MELKGCHTPKQMASTLTIVYYVPVSIDLTSMKMNTTAHCFFWICDPVWEHEVHFICRVLRREQQNGSESEI